jgi:hypothetical protein
MEDLKTSIPLFKKIDRGVFERLDKFKTSTSYSGIQDFYNGLEEEQQKFFKAVVILFIFIIPALFLGLVWWQNNRLKADLETRIDLISKANQIIGQRQGLREISPRVLSDAPIDGESMMSSRLSNLLSSASVDLSKIQVSNYSGDVTAGNIQRSEADFQFTNLSTDELMNVFIGMIQREKFRIQSVNIKRNGDTNLLQGTFHAIHFGNAQNVEGEE